MKIDYVCFYVKDYKMILSARYRLYCARSGDKYSIMLKRSRYSIIVSNRLRPGSILISNGNIIGFHLQVHTAYKFVLSVDYVDLCSFEDECNVIKILYKSPIYGVANTQFVIGKYYLSAYARVHDEFYRIVSLPALFDSKMIKHCM